jgi:hypothetical protein
VDGARRRRGVSSVEAPFSRCFGVPPLFWRCGLFEGGVIIVLCFLFVCGECNNSVQYWIRCKSEEEVVIFSISGFASM